MHVYWQQVRDCLQQSWSCHCVDGEKRPRAVFSHRSAKQVLTILIGFSSSMSVGCCIMHMSAAWICASQVQEFACKTCMAVSLGNNDDDDNDGVCVRRVMNSVWHWPKKLRPELLRMARRPRPLPALNAEGKSPHAHLKGVPMWSVLLPCISAHADTALSAISSGLLLKSSENRR